MAKGYRSICFWRYYKSDVGYNHQQRPCPSGKTLMIFWYHADLGHHIPSLLSGCLCSGVITCCCGFSELLHWISFLVMTGDLYLSWTLPSFIPQCTATSYFSVKYQIINYLILRSISGFRVLTLRFHGSCPLHYFFSYEETQKYLDLVQKNVCISFAFSNYMNYKMNNSSLHKSASSSLR